MDVKCKVLLLLFNKSKLRNETKTFLVPIFSLFRVKFKNILGFSAPLINPKNRQTDPFLYLLDPTSIDHFWLIQMLI